MIVALALAWLVVAVWLRRREAAAAAPAAGPSRRLLAALAAGAAAGWLYYLLPLGGLGQAFPIDDSYITLTAARNFAQRWTLAVNPEHPLAGVTSPLHAALVGVLGKAIGVAAADRALGLLALVAGVCGVYVWTRRLDAAPSTAVAAAGAWAVSGPALYGALNGLETDLFAALIVWSLVAFEYSTDRPRWFIGMGLLLGAAILTRPEGYFLAAALFAARAVSLWRARQFRLLPRLGGAALATLAVVAPYGVANWRLYGQWTPATVAAKRNFFGAACQPCVSRVLTLLLAPILLLGVLYLFAPLLAASRTWRARRAAPWFLCAFYVAYLVQFPAALLHYFGRYQHPLLPVVLTGIILGADELTRRWPAASRKLRAALAVALATVLLLGAGAGGEFQRYLYRRNIRENAPGGELYDSVQWVKRHSAPGDLVATHDIGALSYFGERRVLDLVGLTDPAIARLYADEKSSCDALLPRARALYHELERRRPKIVYFAPHWDRQFLGIVDYDMNRHLTYSGRMRKKITWFDESKIEVYGYDFYRGDWDNNL